jgi:hypothetical protein
MKIELKMIDLGCHPGILPTGKTQLLNSADFLSRLRLNEHAGKHHGSTAAFIDDGKILLGLVRPDVD